MPPVQKIIVKSISNIGIDANLPCTLSHHTPEGWNVGLGSDDESRRTDFALQVLQSYLQSVGYRGEKTRIASGKCFTLAWALHKDFALAFIGNMPRSGGTITRAEIQAWLLVNGRNANMDASPEDEDGQ